MEDYQKKFVRLLADSGALFFEDGLKLKDERPTPYLVNIGNISNNAYFARELGNAYARMIYNEIRNSNINKYSEIIVRQLRNKFGSSI